MMGDSTTLSDGDLIIIKEILGSILKKSVAGGKNITNIITSF
jgi:hypothetical protein